MIIIYPKDDGGVEIVIPAPKWLKDGGTMEKLAAKVVPEGKKYKIVEESAVPSDRTFRDAWENYESVTTNVTKAKEITKTRLRVEREPKLLEQDTLFMKALEAGSDTTAIVKEKNRLRDITKQVDSVSDLDKLKALSTDE